MGRPKIWYYYTCEKCGIEFKLDGSKKRRNNKVYCSNKCFGQWAKSAYKGKTFSEPPHPSGKKHPRWKGGWIDSNGYKVFGLNGKQIYEHRFIMEKHLGRKLKLQENIHHIDGNKLNNKIENLELFKNKSKHSEKYHS